MNSFWKGVASIFDFTKPKPKIDIPSDWREALERDWKAIEKDWEAIEQDWEQVLGKDE